MNTPTIFSGPNFSLKMNRPAIMAKSGFVATTREVMVGD